MLTSGHIRGSDVLCFEFDRPFCRGVRMVTPTRQAIATYSCQAAKSDLLRYGEQAVQRGNINVKTTSSSS